MAPVGVSQVSEHVYVCAIADVCDATVRRHGIELIVDAANLDQAHRKHYAHKIDTSGGLVVRHLKNVPNKASCDMHKHFDTVSRWIDECVAGGGNALLHCDKGTSRSPTLAMAYLMKARRMTLREAFDQLAAARPHIKPNKGFWRQLMRYERELIERNTVAMEDIVRFQHGFHMCTLL